MEKTEINFQNTVLEGTPADVAKSLSEKVIGPIFNAMQEENAMHAQEFAFRIVQEALHGYFNVIHPDYLHVASENMHKVVNVIAESVSKKNAEDKVKPC